MGGSSCVTYELCENKLFEYLAAKFKIQNFNFILAHVYRNLIIEFILQEEKYIFVTGDVNVNLLVLEDSIYP